MFQKTCHGREIHRYCNGLSFSRDNFSIGSLILLAAAALFCAGCQKPATDGKPNLIQPLKLAADAPVDYNFHVKPILSNNCFACHGPDKNKRESGLRLDTFAGATTNFAEDGAQPKYAVVPGEPEQSEIWKRINHQNPDLVMPPAESNKQPLSDEERSIIQRWIAQGAEYKPHWSFIPPEKPELPTVNESDWPKNEIDYFILSKIEELGTNPSPAADKETLIRRVSLDLTGLPPTPQEIDEFLQDNRPDAYERLVERLFQSPHHGERMALDWLDVARYGDTNAHHIDMERTSWPWRDWVIRAFNENKPYDQFILEQVAGDLLDAPTLDQVLATSFNRNHPITNEGGAISEEYLVEYAADRVHTVSTAFMGMTMSCARCHDHKYDPLSIKDYYSMMSFFNSNREIGLERQNPTEAEGYKPFIYIAQNKEDQQALDDSRQAMEDLQPILDAAEWQETAERLTSENTIEWQQLETAFEQALWNGKKVAGPKEFQFKAQFDKNKQDELFREAGTLEFDVSLKDLPQDSNLLYIHFYNLKFNQAGDKRNPTSMEGPSKITGIDLQLVHGPQLQANKAENLTVSEFWSSDQLFKNKQPVSLALDDDPGTYWLLNPSDRSLGLVLRLERAIKAEDNSRLRLTINLAENSFPPVQYSTMNVFAANNASGLDELADRLAPFSPMAITPKKARRSLREQLALEWVIANNQQDAAVLDEWLQLKEWVYNIGDSTVRVAVMSEKEEPTPTYVLERGAYDAPLKDQPVSRDIPVVFGELDPDYPKDRRGLAQWLIEEDNPLTARVTVNRYWQMIFGTGLVKTSEDFGAQGELPSHPELLDFLAVSFVESGWDTRNLIRNIVTSATYRQQSVFRPEFRLADPENRLLAWFPRQRLQAEFIRDNALAASGLLVPKVGGPSVKPYQPAGLWREKAMKDGKYNTGIFQRDDGEDLYRRGMYTFWKQVAPPPQMEAFDAPSREVCVTKRSVTNTPMQALTLLNDITYLEAARSLAERLIKEVPGAWEESLDERLSLGYRYLTGRKPSAQSLEVLRQLTSESYQNFAGEGASPQEFVAYGESPPLENIDPVEYASLTFTASALLNLDKTITRD